MVTSIELHECEEDWYGAHAESSIDIEVIPVSIEEVDINKYLLPLGIVPVRFEGFFL